MSDLPSHLSERPRSQSSSSILSTDNHQQHQKHQHTPPLSKIRQLSHDFESMMTTSNPSTSTSATITCAVPTKMKYSFGLYFPPRSRASFQQQQTSSSRLKDNANQTTTNMVDIVDCGGEMVKSVSDLGSGISGGRMDPKVRKTSLDETSSSSLMSSSSYNIPSSSISFSPSAKSREYFVRYSTSGKPVTDGRQLNNSARHSAYEKTTEKPIYVITRSQTVSTMSPISYSSSTSSQKSSLTSPLYRHSMEIPARGDNSIIAMPSSQNASKHANNTGNHRGGDFSFNNITSGNGNNKRTVLMRIPCGEPQHQHQQQQLQRSQNLPSTELTMNVDSKQMYGTTFAVTRSPAITHIEIQQQQQNNGTSINNNNTSKNNGNSNKPTVSHRKHLFETGQNENNPPPHSNGHHNRYKTEIDKIRTQPKFSSIATRMASFEQSPDRDPAGSDSSSSEDKGSNLNSNCASVGSSSSLPVSSIETAQPTIKVSRGII